MTVTSAFRAFGMVLILAIVASACRYSLVGDSRMAQIAAQTDHGQHVVVPSAGFNSTPFRSWTGVGTGFSTGTITPADLVSDKDYVVMAVSINDATCRSSAVDGPWDCSTNIDGYVAARQALSGYNVIVIEGQPAGGPAFGADQATINARLAAITEAVRIEYGCALVPWSIMDEPQYDGLHYIAGQGDVIVAARFELLDESNYCWTAS
jgi:hypothetical protein